MAKTVARRKQLTQLTYDSNSPGVVLAPTPFWVPPQGMDTVSRLSRVDHGHAAVLRNLRLRDQTIVSRPGTDRIGLSPVVGPLMGVLNFVTSDGLGWLIRFKTNGVEWFDGIFWNSVTVPGGLTGGETNYFAYTAFNDKLLFSNGIDGLFEWDFALGSIAKLTEAPAANYLTTFGGRVIASSVFVDGIFYPTRQQWSVKNNSRDWKEVDNDLTGVGAGFEDILSTPGGSVDQARGVHPISDYTAIVLRSRSTWQMTETGNPDAPFRFTRIYSELGTDSGYSAANVPGGVVCLMNDDVYVISDSTLTAIGTKIRRTIFNEVTRLERCVGAYDFDEKEYALLVPVEGGSKIWRYNFINQGWTFDEYSNEMRWISYTRSNLIGLTIDSATGDIDSAGPLSIDSEVGEGPRKGMLYASSILVFGDNSAVSQDAGVEAAIEATTGIIAASSPLEKTEVPEIQMEYESDADQQLEFEYREGTTDSWHVYETGVQIHATSGPQMLSVRQTVIGHNLQFRVRSDILGKLRILSLVPMLNIAQNQARG